MIFITMMTRIPFSYLAEGFLNWFMDREKIDNRTGRWFVGVMAIKADKGNVSTLLSADEGTCEDNNIEKDWLDENFNTQSYNFRVRDKIRACLEDRIFKIIHFPLDIHFGLLLLQDCHRDLGVYRRHGEKDI